MADTIPANASTSASIAIGGSTSSAIDFNGDHDWFRVSLTAGETYVFNLDATTFSDTYLQLFNSAGTLLRANDDVTPGIDLDSQIRFTATASGTYYLDASAFNYSDTGSYTISAALAPPLPTYTIDQVAAFLTDGYWNGQGYSGYQFATTSISFNVTDLSGAQQTLARLALQTWHDVANLTFVETTSSAQITFNNNGSGVAETNADGSSATIQISSNWNGGNTAIFGYTFQTYIHEIGHALGLGHAGPYNGNATYGIDNIYANDSWAISVMSYFSQDEAGTGSYDLLMGPQLADIVAVASLYGAATATRLGDTVYGFNSNAGQLYNFADPIYGGQAPALTIFDNAGSDTLDVSGYSVGQRIDLQAEHYSDIGGYFNNIAIARGTTIENAIGGSGSDSIDGNSAANNLFGGSGADTIYALDGNDYVDGGTGADQMYGGDGNDIYGIDDAGDVVFEGSGVNSGFDVIITTVNHTLEANVEQLVLQGTATSGTGNGGDNILYGINSGAVLTLDGASGNDVLYGSLLGGNTLTGGSGNDTLFGYGGSNTMQGGTGADIYFTYTASDVISEAGGDGSDFVYTTHNITLASGVEAVWLYDAATSATSLDAADNNIMYGTAAGSAVSLSGGGGSDVLYGTAAFGDTLTGGAGVDLLFGFGGANALIGGDDTDIYYLESGLDTITETLTGGFDTIYSQAAGTTTIATNVEQLILYGAATGGLGNGADNYLYGHIASQALTLDGAGGNDYLLDSVFGGDVLTGGAGTDQLDLRTGGNDFIRYAASGSGADYVYGFDANPAGGQDIIDVSGRGFSAGSIGSSIIISAAGADTIVTIGSDTIQFVGVVSTDITASDFLF